MLGVRLGPEASEVLLPFTRIGRDDPPFSPDLKGPRVKSDFARGFGHWDDICFKLNLASGLFRERAAGWLALALRRLVSRHIGTRLVFVRLWFLIFLVAFLRLRHGDPLDRRTDAEFPLSGGYSFELG
jgi:hypothetical protein